jgi:hypothetical protein
LAAVNFAFKIDIREKFLHSKSRHTVAADWTEHDSRCFTRLPFREAQRMSDGGAAGREEAATMPRKRR